MCDVLEPRRLFDALIPDTDGHTASADSWYIRPYGAYFDVWSPIPANIDSPGTPTLGTFTSVSITGGGGDDTVLLDARSANFTGTVHFSGGDDHDVLQLLGHSSGGMFYLADTSSYGDSGGLPLISGCGASAYSDAEFLTLGSTANASPAVMLEAYGSFSGQTIVLGSDVGESFYFDAADTPIRLAASQQNSSLLTLPSVTAAPGANIFIRAASLPSNMDYASLDLNDNSLIIDYSGSSPLATLRQFLSNGRAGGDWDGATGIKSSVAHDTAAYFNQTRLQGIGYAEAGEFAAVTPSPLTSWHEQTVDATTLLVRGTWLGDANLDGTVNAADFDTVRRSIAYYATLDSTARIAWVNWLHGDFDYDGDIDSDDLALMTASYNAITDAHFDSLTGTDHNRTVNSSSSVSDILSALDILKNNQGGTLTVDGTINLGTTGLLLEQYSNIRIRAAATGGGFTVTTVPYFSEGPFRYNPGILMLKNCQDIFIHGIFFNGNNLYVDGTSADTCARLTIDACDFTAIHTDGDNPTSSNHSQAGTDNRYTNNYVHDGPGGALGPGGIVTSGQSWGASDTGTIIVGNTLRRHTYDAFNGYMINALIAGNDIDGLHHVNPSDDSPSDTVTGGGMALSSTTNNFYDQSSSGCVVFENGLANSVGAGFQFDSWNDGFALNCTVFRNDLFACAGTGILISGADGCEVIDNVCIENGYGLMSFGAKNVLICGNTFYHSASAGIYIEAHNLRPIVHSDYFISSNVTITNNTIDSNGGSGIHIQMNMHNANVCYILEIDINNNQITNNSAEGVHIEMIENSTGEGAIDTILIAANHIQDNDGHWLYIKVLNNDDIINVAGSADNNIVSGNGYNNAIFDNHNN